MKKIILIFLLFTSSLFAQSWWTPKQEATIDSLREAIDSLGTISLPPLSYGRLWIGDAAGYPASRTFSGDVTVDYLGVTTIGNLKITNAKVATGIDAVKLGNGTITNAEFQTLNGINTAKTIQQQIDDIEVGTGFTLNGPETNLEIAWTVGEGNEYGILFGEDNQVNFPTLTDISNLDPGKYGMKGDSLYVGLNSGTEKLMLEFQVDAKLDSVVKYGEADIKQQEVDTLDFSSAKVIDSWFGREDGPQTVEIINYTAKTISFFVQSSEGVTFDFNGKTAYYLDRLGLPAFTDGKQYLVTMIYSRNGVYVSYGEYGSAL